RRGQRPPAEKPALAQFASPQFTPLLAGPSITGPESLSREHQLAVWPRGGACAIYGHAARARDMKGTLALLAKFGVTLAIFVGIFLEFGGGYRAVRTAGLGEPGVFEAANPAAPSLLGRLEARLRGVPLPPSREAVSDRKSTRLNSSHVAISYAVFCLKKKRAD